MEKFYVPSAVSLYPSLGAAYKRPGYQIEYSNSLVRTGKNYYDSRDEIPQGDRMSTAAEELAIQLSIGKTGQDPRQAAVFGDLFARNDPYVHIWQWTKTGLRVPKGRDPEKYETDDKGRKYWARELLEDDNVVAEILVPEGDGHVVVEWDKVSGLPRNTEKIDFPHSPYTTHFWFNPTPSKDIKSGHYDVAVARNSDWSFDVDGECLVVYALRVRWDAGSIGGFRPVRGSLPGITITRSDAPRKPGNIVYL